MAVFSHSAKGLYLGWPKQIGGGKRRLWIVACTMSLLIGIMTLAGNSAVAASDSDDQPKGQFSGYDVRVIRPRFFTKARRAEFGGQMSVVMNQTFIYTYLMTGILNYHFTESLGIELDGSYGFSLDKEDKTLLKSSFNISTQIQRTQYQFLGGLVWTPLYGKYQLASGKLIYFDTFLIGGGGMTGVDYQYDHCSASATGQSVPPPAANTKSYFGGIIGIGQRFFIDKNLSLRFEVRDNIFSVDERDGSCDPDFTNSSSKMINNVTMQVGASRFL